MCSAVINLSTLKIALNMADIALFWRRIEYEEIIN